MLGACSGMRGIPTQGAARDGAHHPRQTQTMFRPIPGAMPALTDPPAGCRFHPRCPRVLTACARVTPRPVRTGPGHSVACHRYRRPGDDREPVLAVSDLVKHFPLRGGLFA